MHLHLVLLRLIAIYYYIGQFALCQGYIRLIAVYNINMNKFKDRLKEVLAENGVSQRALAKKLFMSQTIINNYCTGKREPPLDTLIAICKELDVSADYLLGLID